MELKEYSKKNQNFCFFKLDKSFAFINGGSSSVVERQIVDLVVEGSNPFFHPLLSSERLRS